MRHVWYYSVTARCNASAVLARGLCLSVCLSQVGVLLKRLNVGSHKHHTIAQGFLKPKISAKFDRDHPLRAGYGGAKCRLGGSKSAPLTNNRLGLYLETVQDRRMVSLKVEKEVVCALSNGGIAHDLECPLTAPNHSIFCILHRHS